MRKLLLSRVLNRVRIVIVFFALLSFTALRAQTLLIPGDVLMVCINSSDQSAELIPLVQLEEGTVLYFSNGTWDNEDEAFLNGNEYQITLLTDVPAGQGISISNQESGIYSASGEFKISDLSSQLYVYQIDEEQFRFTTAIFWEPVEPGLILYPKGDVPRSFVENEAHYLNLGKGFNFQYQLRHGASGTYSMLRNMVYNQGNWKTSQRPFDPFQTSFRILEPPVIVFNEVRSNHQEGDPIPLNVAIFGHDGSRLTVDLSLNTVSSTADTFDVKIPEVHTYNFTGLIGDATYEIEVPNLDDAVYEGTETALFELVGLSKGTFGDFVSHAAFIEDNELPDMDIIGISYAQNDVLDYIEIRNNERVQVDLSNWRIVSGENSGEINSFRFRGLETRRLYLKDLLLEDPESTLLTGNAGLVQLATKTGVEISTKEYRLLSENGDQLNTSISENNLPVNTNRGNQEGIRTGIQGQITELEIDSSFTTKWFTVSVDELDQYAGEPLYFWNERTQRFDVVDVFDIDSLIGFSIFSLEQEYPRKDDLIEHLNLDTTIVYPDEVAIPSSIQVEWEIRISGTDLDGNGMLNDAEGFNFLKNESVNELSVKQLFEQIEEEFASENLIHPFVYVWPEDGTGWDGVSILDEQGKIPANASFWIKADSVFSPIEIPIAVDNAAIDLVEMENITEDPSSYLVLELASGEMVEHVTVNLFETDEAVELPVSSMLPQLNDALYMGETEYLNFGIHNSTYWTNELNAWALEDAKLTLPLGVTSDISERMKLSVADWGYIPRDWNVYLENAETGERTEVTQTLNFEFEYRFEPVELQEETIYDELPATVYAEYNLVFVPPGIEESVTEEPEIVSLFQNYPNPFNPVTTISFYLPETEEVRLSVFNVVGQPVAVLTSGTLSAGDHHFDWDATGFPSGMYIYQLEIKNQIMTRKMTLVK